MKTIWSPSLRRSGNPLYREIADALDSDIAAGLLPVGTRLPTHRDLAWELKVTVGTVSRAYAEAERRGLIGGEVGRGTYVRPQRRIWRDVGSATDTDGFVDLSVNYPIAGSEPGLLAVTLTEMAQRPGLGEALHYQPHAGRDADRRAGAAWLRRTGLPSAVAERIVVTHGGQHGIAVLLSALSRPGDAVAVEQLTWPGVKAAAQLAGIQLVGVAMDEHGLCPEALDTVCRTRPVKFLYTLPTLQNPTTATMPPERRREIADIVRRRDLTLIEDDVYGFLREPAEPAMAELLPERGFYITSASKSLAPGLRIGWIHAPAEAVDRVGAGLRASTYMATPITAMIATTWIEDGMADQLAAEKRLMAATRQKLARQIFGQTGGGAALKSEPTSLHCWLRLPEPWRAEEFTAAARGIGIGVTPAAAFAVGPAAATPEAIRFCLGTVSDIARLEGALRSLAGLTATIARPYLSVV